MKKNFILPFILLISLTLLVGGCEQDPYKLYFEYTDLCRETEQSLLGIHVAAIGDWTFIPFTEDNSDYTFNRIEFKDDGTFTVWNTKYPQATRPTFYWKIWEYKSENLSEILYIQTDTGYHELQEYLPKWPSDENASWNVYPKLFEVAKYGQIDTVNGKHDSFRIKTLEE